MPQATRPANGSASGGGPTSSTADLAPEERSHQIPPDMSAPPAMEAEATTHDRGRATGASADQMDHFGPNRGSVGWTSVSLTTALPASS
jgi:hypothetical protein